jgi:hypothetical protein
VAVHDLQAIHCSPRSFNSATHTIIWSTSTHDHRCHHSTPTHSHHHRHHPSNQPNGHHHHHSTPLITTTTTSFNFNPRPPPPRSSDSIHGPHPPLSTTILVQMERRATSLCRAWTAHLKRVVERHGAALPRRQPPSASRQLPRGRCARGMLCRAQEACCAHHVHGAVHARSYRTRKEQHTARSCACRWWSVDVPTAHDR